MEPFNAKILRFADGTRTFYALPANGVYVEKLPAKAPEVVDRLVKLPTGAIHDLDGTADAALRPPRVHWDLLFSGEHPSDHDEYDKLMNMVGHRGTLTAEIPTATTTQIQTCTARLVRAEGESRLPYAVGASNWLKVRVEFQMLDWWT